MLDDYMCYFDSDEQEASRSRSCHGCGDNIGRFKPIYEEVATFYDLYRGEGSEVPASTSGSSDGEDDSEASSQYGPNPRSPNTTQDNSSFWPVIVEDEVDDTFSLAELSSHSPSNVIEDDNDADDELERRGRSRAVPAKLLRRVDEVRRQKGQIQESQGQEIETSRLPKTLNRSV